MKFHVSHFYEKVFLKINFYVLVLQKPSLFHTSRFVYIGRHLEGEGVNEEYIQILDLNFHLFENMIKII